MRVRKFFWFLIIGLVFLGQSAHAGSYALEAELQQSFRESRVIIARIQAAVDVGEDVQADLANLKNQAENVRVVDLLIQERLRSRSEGAAALGEPAKSRHAAIESRYRAAVSHFLSLVDGLANIPDADTLQNLLTLLDRLLPEKRHPILGSLPYSHLNSPASQPKGSPLVVPAYRGGSRIATAADTEGTADAPITHEISDLAKSLDWNPVLIYEWVQENIETEWYWGSMKGARETLRQRSGNDADQAALLIALLRSAGFPARYVRGIIEFFPGIDKARSLTGLDDPLKIAAFFQKAGIPFEPIIVGGKIANFQIEHIWVETEVPYSNYRGAIIDSMGKTWIALDTHLKPAGYIWNGPKDFGPDFNLAALRDDYLFQPRTETPLDYLRDAFGQYLAGNFADITYQDHLRSRTLVTEPQGILPASLQFHQATITGEYTELPSDLRHQVTFTAASTEGSELFTITFDAASLSNRSVSLSYEPETVQDQQIIHSYGGLDNTPSYLVRLRPVLTLDGERMVVGQDGLPMGTDYILTVGLTSPNGRHEVASHHVIGNLSSLGIASQKVVQPAELPLEENDAEHLLHEAALSYIDRWNAAEEELAAFLKVNIVRPLPTIVTVGGAIDVAYLFDVPHGFEWKGVFIDAGFRRIETVAATGQEERAREFMRLSALEGSILENRLFEDNFGVASISTAKLLTLAPQNLADLQTLDGSNIDAILPMLDLAENVKADIRNAVHQGHTVTLPEAETGYKNWTGIGYIKENLDTGEAGYMLSGMIAGGMTAEEWADQILRERFENAYSEPPNQDPGAAARIFMIPVSDRQNGTVGQEVEEPLAVLVVDLEGRPVAGAEVTFTALAGGAHFDGAATAQATTGGNGIAKARPTLGTMTKNNPSYLRTNQGDAYVTQVGVNLFSATVSSKYGILSVPKPFEVYGQPDVPVTIVKVVGDGNWSMANNPVGSLKVLVLDQYQNPVSNVPVTFKTESAASMNSSTGLPQNYRSVTFYDNKECANEYPLFGECPSSASITRMTAHFGVGVEAILGNTVNTRYEVSANTPGVPNETFTLYSGGYWEEGRYIPPQLFIRHLTRINDQGEEVNAAKAGEQLKAPLVATMFLMTSDYTMEGPTACTKYDSKGQPYQTNCWTIKGSGLINTKRINDGTVLFTPLSGDGSVSSTENLGDGSYQAAYTTGSIPSLNRIEAIGEATVTLPQVYGNYYEVPIEGGYTVDTLPLRTVTLKSGQKGLFNQTTKELLSQTPQKTSYNVYGVDVATEVSPKVLFLGEESMSRDNLTVTYTVLPSGEPPAGYGAVSAQVDLSSVGLSGGNQWEGYLVGSAIKGTGTAIFSYGKEFDLQKNYYVQPVLNRGGDIEIRGDKVALKIVSVDLDIDSDNNAGFNSDGTHKDPQRGPIEDQVEDHAGAPGKIIRPNLLDVDGDKVPGFADGINMHGNEGDGASAPFTPILLEIGGNFDPTKARVRFIYSASDPAGVAKGTDTEDRDIYTPADGHLRLWTKDGGQSRHVASLKNGGNFVKSGELYSLADLGQKAENGYWRFWVEGIRDTATAEEGRIKIEIDFEGTAQTYYLGDVVQTIVRSFALIPDYNHDRQIDEEDRQRALAGDTYYFWINDDDDEEETYGSDIPGEVMGLEDIKRIFDGKLPIWTMKTDGKNSRVDGVRDLIDFFPLFFDIKDLMPIFPPAEFEYRLSIGLGQANFAIAPLGSSNAGAYLTDVSIARSLHDATVWPVSSEGTNLNSLNGMDSPPWLQTVGSNPDAGVLLFEGVQKNFSDSNPEKAPLKLQIFETGKQVFELTLNLSLDGVEQMFRHLNLVKAISSVPDTLKIESSIVIGANKAEGGEQTRFYPPENYPDSESSEDYVVWIHGFNVDGQSARGWQSEMFKRLYWSGSRARFVGVTWYGFERAPYDYHKNVLNAFDTAVVLGPKLKDIVVDSQTTLMAHSLGNMVASSYLTDYYPHQVLNIKNYFLLNAAVALEAYLGDYQQYAEESKLSLPFDDTDDSNHMVHSAWHGYERRLGTSEWYQHFKGIVVDGQQDHRYYLTWRNRFAELPTDTVDVYNFYSSGEDVLASFAGDGPKFMDFLKMDLGRNSWVIQEKWKGRWPFNMGGSNLMGWGFNYEDYINWTDWNMDGVVDFEETNYQSPAEVNGQVPSSDLRTKPFFRKFAPWQEEAKLLVPGLEGSLYAHKHRNRMLAMALPALTTPSGGEMGFNLFIRRNLQVFNMEDFQNDWPEIRGNIKNWWHSDIKEIAFSHVSKIVQLMVTSGGLR